MKKFILTIFSVCLMAFPFLYGCASQQRVHGFGDEPYTGPYGSVTLVSANFADKISVQDMDVDAPPNKRYLVVKMNVTMTSGNWSVISEFELHRNGQSSQAFDRDLTKRRNGKEILKTNSPEAQIIELVYILDEKEDPIDNYSIIIQYVDGSCSEPFVML